MKVLKLDGKNQNGKLKEAAELLKSGGVLIFPTETVYGLGANIYDEEAVARVYALKERDENKPLSIALPSIDEIEKYAMVDAKQMEFIRQKLPGPLTVVLEKTELVPDYLCKKTVGIRVPDHKVIQELLKLSGPITATSANVSSRPAPQTFEEVSIEADMALDGGACTYKKPSRVIDLTTGEVIRE